MILILLLTWSCFLVSNEQEVKLISLSEPLTIEDPKRQCAKGFHYRKVDCPKKNHAWHVKVASKIKGTPMIEEDYATLDECIGLCENKTECFAAAMNSEMNCLLFRPGYFINPLEEDDGWTSIEFICCQFKQKPTLSSNISYHNLPIIFEANDDCLEGSKTARCCPSDKVWVIHQRKMHNVEFKTIYNLPRLGCLNECINDLGCAYVNERLNKENTCYLIKDDRHEKKIVMSNSDRYDAFTLKCCKLNKYRYPVTRKENLPIIYDLPKFCVNYTRYSLKSQSNCEMKIWHAIPSASLESFYRQEQGRVKLFDCLNNCLLEKQCRGVSFIPGVVCAFHIRNGSRIAHGKRLSSAYLLACCNIELEAAAE